MPDEDKKPDPKPEKKQAASGRAAVAPDVKLAPTANRARHALSIFQQSFLSNATAIKRGATALTNAGDPGKKAATDAHLDLEKLNALVDAIDEFHQAHFPEVK